MTDCPRIGEPYHREATCRVCRGLEPDESGPVLSGDEARAALKEARAEIARLRADTPNQNEEKTQ